jgi:hypothetical protein
MARRPKQHGRPKEKKATTCSKCKKGTDSPTECQASKCGLVYCRECSAREMDECDGCNVVTCIGCNTLWSCDSYCDREDEGDGGRRAGTVCDFCKEQNTCAEKGCGQIAFPCCGYECDGCGLYFCHADRGEHDDSSNEWLCTACWLIVDQDADVGEGEEDVDDDDA